MAGLSVNDVVNIDVSIAALAAQFRNFGIGLLVGSTPGVIDTAERIRQYSSIEGVIADFGTGVPEYAAASIFFQQSPKPSILKIGFWAQAATKGRLNGGVLTTAQRLLSVFTAITDGRFNISIDGVAKVITGCDFSTQLNLNGVAAVIQTKLNTATAGTTCVWDATRGRFVITSPTTGVSSAISYATVPNPAGGTDLGPIMNISQAAGASVPVNGIAAENTVAGYNALVAKSAAWYALMYASTTPPTDADLIVISQMIEASSVKRLHFITTAAPGVIDPTSTSDIAYSLKALALKRTWVQYSTTNAYAACSVFARAATVDFTGANTTLTMKFKQLPGVAADEVTESQAQALGGKNANIFVLFENDTSIIIEGKMSNGYFFDEVFNSDWLANYVQTNLYNALYQAPTKIPQTDPGIHTLTNVANSSMAQAVRNGMLAPGIWNGPPIGSVKTGDFLTTGYQVYVQPVATQAQADREARKMPPMQIMAKFAGAVHSANVLITINR